LIGASCANAALADGFYVSGSVGGDQRERATGGYTLPHDPLGRPISTDFSYDINYQAGVEGDVAAGYRFSLPHRLGAVRAELGFQYDHYQLGSAAYLTHGTPADDFQYYSTELNGHGNAYEAFNTTLNVFYDFTQFGAVVPYFGIGAGDHLGTVTSGTRLLTYTDSVPQGLNAQGLPIGKTLYSYTGKTTEQFASTHTDVGSYLAEVGVSFPLNRHLSIVPAYRFTNEFRNGVPLSTIKLGLRYGF
jgi:opacity protein-like surface antigen